METFKDLPVLLFQTRQDWCNWLETHPLQSTGLWLKLAKKNTGAVSVSYDEALEEALCYGWIDGQIQSYDNQYYLQRFTPRRPQSIWSKANTIKATALISQGRMRPAGLDAISIAKKNGAWERAYDSSTTMSIPPDFEQALLKNSKAKLFYDSLTKSNTYAFNWRIQSAKTPETRSKLIIKFVTMLENKKTLH